MNVTSSTARILAEQQICGRKMQNPKKQVRASSSDRLIAKTRTLPEVSGFQRASKKVRAQDYQRYYIELKCRKAEFDPENIPENAEINPDDHLEILIGDIEVLVPKSLRDKRGEVEKRQIWDDYATVCGYCLLYSVEAYSRGCNQLFIFSHNKTLIKRAEFSAWDEGHGTEGLYIEEVSNESLKRALKAIRVCLLNKMNWLTEPSEVAA
jgi:hypothetical protein